MNYLLLIAGIIATGATIGHFAIGAKSFLKPVMRADVDEVPKRVMESLFHYMSVYLILTTIILLAFSFGNNLVFKNQADVIKLIGFSYAGFAIVQFLVALTSPVKMGIVKIFQWVFWALIALFSLLSIYLRIRMEFEL